MVNQIKFKCIFIIINILLIFYLKYILSRKLRNFPKLFPKFFFAPLKGNLIEKCNSNDGKT